MDWAILFALCLQEVRFTIPKQQMFYRKLTYPTVIFSVIKPMVLKKIRTYTTERNAKYIILPRENNPDPWYCDHWLYKERHLIECFFNKIKAFCRVATRYDKLVSSFLAFVHIASIWLLSK